MPLADADRARLLDFPFFRSLEPATLARILDATNAFHFGADSVLFREGEIPKDVFVALDGLVGLKTINRLAKEFFVEFMRPGQLFLVGAAVLERPYLLTGQVLQEGRVAIIPLDLFEDCAATNLSFAKALNAEQARLRRSLIYQMKSALTRSLAERLAEFLLSLASGDGPTTVTLPCDRQVLASWFGMAPNSLGRAFHSLEAVGVTGRGRLVSIKSAERLREYLKGAPSAPGRRPKGPPQAEARG